jgi:hypothetical protein
MRLWSLIYFPLWDAWVSCTASLVQYIEGPLLAQRRQVESLVSLDNSFRSLLLPVAETATQAISVRPELYKSWGLRLYRTRLHVTVATV